MAVATGATTGAPMMGTPASAGAAAPAGAEISGASRIKWGALLGLLGLALAIGGIILAITALPLGSVVFSPAGSNAILDAILIAVLVVIAGVFLAFLSFILYVSGFASLRTADGRFRTPMVLGLIGVIGILLVGVFTIFYALSIQTAIACSPSDINCQNNATTLARGIVVLGYLGGLLGFIGLIGTIIGLYRFGARYSSSMVKVGGILYIVPFLAIVAPLLVFIGAHQVHGRLRRGVGVSPPVGPMAPPA